MCSRFTQVVAAAAIGLAALLGSAGIAHADPGSGVFGGPKGDNDDNAFWVNIGTFGVNGTIAQAGTLGRDICAKQTPGISEGDAIAGMAQALEGGGTSATRAIPDATFIVHAAEWHYCPSKYTTA